jgi:hypothetical protein
MHAPRLARIVIIFTCLSPLFFVENPCSHQGYQNGNHIDSGIVL